MVFCTFKSLITCPSMQLDLTDEEAAALLNILTRIIEGDRYPMSRRMNTLR